MRFRIADFSELNPLNLVSAGKFRGAHQRIRLGGVPVGQPIPLVLKNVDGSSPAINIANATYSGGKITFTKPGNVIAYVEGNFNGMTGVESPQDEFDETRSPSWNIMAEPGSPRR